MTGKISIHPATPDRWEDLCTVFEDCGDARHCWCAYWYRSNRDFRAGRRAGNRRFFANLVRAGAEPGVIAYRDGEPVGWCGVAPRSAFDRLGRARALAAIDDAPVWSINCFVVKKRHRRQGLMRALIRGAVRFARRKGARILEAYPIDSARPLGSGELYTGTPAAFRDEGFVEMVRRTPRRPIMRLEQR